MGIVNWIENCLGCSGTSGNGHDATPTIQEEGHNTTNGEMDHPVGGAGGGGESWVGHTDTGSGNYGNLVGEIGIGYFPK